MVVAVLGIVIFCLAIALGWIWSMKQREKAALEAEQEIRFRTRSASAAFDRAPPSAKHSPTHAIVLIGTFPSPSHLESAQKSFAALGFAPRDAICISCDRERRFRTPAPPSLDSVLSSYDECLYIPEETRNSIRSLLVSGRGVVLIRSGDRFGKACEIIQEEGGDIGLTPRQAYRASSASGG